MNTAILAARLIQVFEGCRLRAYRDTGGIWTIGFGHTGPDVISGMEITQAQADALFQSDLQPLLRMVDTLNPIAAAAWVSFGYNCGPTALQRALRGEISLSNYGRTDRKGTPLPGLVARRDLEMALIESGVDTLGQ